MVKRIVMLLAATVALAGCQKKEEAAPVASRAVGPRGALANTVQAGGNLPGRVGADPSYQAAFEDAVKGFLSTDVDPRYVGPISALPQANSGVRFGGKVNLSSGSLRNYNVSFGSAEVSSNSTFLIQVFDSVPAGTAPLPPFTFQRARGQLMGNQAQITFYDAYGEITLQGYLNQAGNTFDGSISYDNNVNFDGSTPGAAGTIGSFSIPACSFFNCQ